VFHRENIKKKIRRRHLSVSKNASPPQKSRTFDLGDLRRKEQQQQEFFWGSKNSFNQIPKELHTK